MVPKTEQQDAATRPGPVTVLKAVGTIIAPVTLITALMYYFGLVHAYNYYDYFRVNYSVFDLSTQDYLVRSADGLFVPFTIAALVILLGSWAVHLVLPRSTPEHRTRAIRIVVPVGSVAGVVLMIVATVGLLNPQGALFLRFPGLGGLVLVLGVLCLLAAVRAERWLWEGAAAEGWARPPVSWLATEWAAVVTLVSVGLFWWVGDWSAGVAQQRAEQTEHQVAALPELVVYSPDALDLTLPGVQGTTCSSGAGLHRYEGLRLVSQENGKLVLLPDGWTRASGWPVAVLDSGQVQRLEFRSPQPGGQQPC